METKDIIFNARKQLRLSRQALADLCNMTKQKLYYLETGRDSLKLEYVKPLCEHLQLSPKELIGDFLDGLDYANDSSLQIRYYHNTYISAGNGAYVNDSEEQAYIALSKSFIKNITNVNEQQLSIVNVDGDSMEPTLRSGDQIIVDHSWTEKSEGIYALHVDGCDYIKRLVFRNDKIQVISDNQLYPMKECQDSEVHIHGRVIWYGRSIARNTFA